MTQEEVLLENKRQFIINAKYEARRKSIEVAARNFRFQKNENDEEEIIKEAEKIYQYLVQDLDK
jgi:galactokinase